MMETLQSMSLPRRQLILAGALLAVILASMIGGYFLWLRDPYQVLANNLRPAEAATIVAELDKRKVPYRLEDGGAAIVVPAKTVDAMRLAIASQDLPVKGTVGFELFNKSDMGLTEFAQQVNYRRALQGELTRTIMEIDGIDSARVHLTLAEPSVFREDRRPAKASITLTPKAGRSLSPATIRGVQSLVASAAPDLDAANVVVLDESGAVVSAEMSSVPSQAAAPTEVEAYYAWVIDLAAKQLLGERPFLVRVEIPPTPETKLWRTPAADEDAPPRQFPLKVSVRVEGELSSAERSQLQGVVIAVADMQPQLGDGLTIEDRPDAPAVAPTMPLGPQVTAPVAPSPGLPNAVVFGLVLGLGGLLTVAAALYRARPTVRALAEPEKDRLALQLQSILSEDKSIAAPRDR